jgi:hypothetical protein
MRYSHRQSGVLDEHIFEYALKLRLAAGLHSGAQYLINGVSAAAKDFRRRRGERAWSALCARYQERQQTLGPLGTASQFFPHYKCAIHFVPANLDFVIVDTASAVSALRFHRAVLACLAISVRRSALIDLARDTPPASPPFRADSLRLSGTVGSESAAWTTRKARTFRSTQPPFHSFDAYRVR